MVVILFVGINQIGICDNQLCISRRGFSDNGHL